MKLHLALIAAVSLTASPAVLAETAPKVETSAKVAHGGLYEIAYNPADKRLYVAATGPRGANAPKVVILDATSLKQVGEIDVSEVGLFGLGIDTRAQILYGTATSKGAIAAIDLKTGAVSSFTLDGSTGAHLREVVADEASGKAYASLLVSGERDGPANAP